MNLKHSKLARLAAAALVAGGLLVGTLAGTASAATVDRYGGPTSTRRPKSTQGMPAR